jgi:hypothetical protein
MTLPDDPLERLRRAVMEAWDPVSVMNPEDGPEEWAAYWDEYDDYLPTIVTHLEQGDIDALAPYLDAVRTTEMGLPSTPDRDRAVAATLAERYREIVGRHS